MSDDHAEHIEYRGEPAKLRLGDADYSGYTHPELYEFVHKNLSPEQVNEIGGGWSQIGDGMLDMAGVLRQCSVEVESHWQGEAAEGAKNFLSALGKWCSDSGRGAALHGDEINAIGDSAEWAERNMPEPDGFGAIGAVSAAAGADASTIGSVGQAFESQAGASGDKHDEAVRVMDGFGVAMRDRSRRVPAFPRPPAFDSSGGGDERGREGGA